jgi:hypothetical protein
LPEHLQIKNAATVETRGERAVHTLAHKVVNFGLNYLLSISITDLSLGSKDDTLKRPTSYLVSLAGKGKFGQAVAKFADGFKYFHDEILFEKTYKGLGGKYKKENGKQVKDSLLQEKVADIVADVFTLMLGGHITATIATWIQNRTDKFARRFDKMFDSFSGKEVSEEEKAQREARYAYLAEQPKVSGWTTVKARFVGFVANLITGSGTAALHKALMNENRRDKAETPDSQTGLKENLGVRAITTALGDKVVTPLFNGVASAFINPDKDYSQINNNMRARRVKFWSEMALFEGVCTLNTSLAHAILTSGKKHKPEVKPKAKPPVTTESKEDKNAMASRQSDNAAVPEASADKKAWADERVTQKGEVKTHDERREELATMAPAVA